MLAHYFLISFRNFKRYKSSFFINLFGLTTGLACALLIYLWVNDELNFDKFHEKNSQIFQLMQNQKTTESIMTTEATPGLLAETLVTEMPQVEYAASAFDASVAGKSTLSFQDKNIKANGLYASKDFFNIFSFHLIQGNENQVLNDIKSIVISEQLANSLFATTNVIGKTVEFMHEKEFIISGIFKGTPLNSSFQFDYVLSFEILKKQYPNFSSWGSSAPSTYVVLKKGTDIQQFNKGIEGLIKNKSGEAFRTLFIRPFSEKYLYDRYENGTQVGGRIAYVKLFSLIAIFIIIIACINFMNLSTARVSRRIKEVGIKKTVGATRISLIGQYLGESILITFLALLISLLLVVIFLPSFNEITGKQITLHFNANLVLSVLSIILFTGLISGSYPALYISGFNTVSVLKDKLKNSMGELWVRKGLVVFQFTLSVILIVSVLVIYKQIELIQTKNPGFDKNHIIYFDKEGSVIKNQEVFLSEVKKIPGVVNASSTGFSIVGSYNTTGGVFWQGKKPDDKVNFEIQGVNYDLIETLGIEMQEGRTFSKDFGTDNTAIIFNDAAIKAIGLQDPIGKKINLWGNDRQIVGVTKNFNFESLHKKVNPLFFILMPERTLKIMIKLKSGTEKETINRLRKYYQGFNPGYSFDFKFLDSDFQTQYASENRVAILSRYFAGFAILISCLGVFGLAAFTAERRSKEIGIRKALGSSDFHIVYLLSSDFTKMVSIAILIALPISYFITEQWLEGFAYRINLRVWYFISAGLLALLITWFTVGIQAIKATRINLSECLRLNE